MNNKKEWVGQLGHYGRYKLDQIEKNIRVDAANRMIDKFNSTVYKLNHKCQQIYQKKTYRLVDMFINRHFEDANLVNSKIDELYNKLKNS
jgi:hypothetical protein